MARPRRLYGQRRPYGSVKARKEPGRPTTGYFRWLIANRARLRRQNPYLNTVNLMRAAGMEWRAMSSRQKQPWIDQAATARRQYNATVRARRAAAAAAAAHRQAASGPAIPGAPNPAAPVPAGFATRQTPAAPTVASAAGRAESGILTHAPPNLTPRAFTFGSAAGWAAPVTPNPAVRNPAPSLFSRIMSNVFGG